MHRDGTTRRGWLGLLSLAAALLLPAGAPIVLADPVLQTGPEVEAVRRVLATITLPAGFSIGLYAMVPDARAMAVGPHGTVFVGTTGSSVFRVVAGADGAPPTVRAFAAGVGFTLPNGVCFAPDGTLYVAEQNRILAFPDAESDAVAEPAPRTVVAQGALIPPAEEGGSHSARVCRIGPDDKLYVAVGQPFNVPPARKLAVFAAAGMGGIVRMDRDGRNREVFASGIRNSVGMDFNPADQTLWFTDNQVDGMGDDIPPGEINHAFRAGLNFGFPWFGGGHTRTREYRAATVPDGVVFPAVEEIAHAADLGMMFYRGTAFPPDYRGAILSAQHGSWNRSISVGARVMVTMLHPDGSVGPSHPFAEGWRQPDGSYAGRPVDVAELPDGSVLVSDDKLGALYRISYAGP